jgi:hypothetical protein
MEISTIGPCNDCVVQTADRCRRPRFVGGDAHALPSRVAHEDELAIQLVCADALDALPPDPAQENLARKIR